jgi:hypothetical protein
MSGQHRYDLLSPTKLTPECQSGSELSCCATFNRGTIKPQIRLTV